MARSSVVSLAAVVALVAAVAVDAQTSKPAPVDAPTLALFPSPWSQGSGGAGWEAAYEQAREFVGQLTLVEKVNLTTGTGWEYDRCIGNTGSIPRLGFRSLCLEDGPVGVRYTDKNSVFPAGINAAATFSRDLMRRRGQAMGEEFRGKGIDVQLGPVAGPLGRVPAGGRNWEGFSPDPFLTGVGMAETVQGIQAAGVIACAKHYILNEQEHFRNNIDVTIDDRTMHELYLWPFADAVRAGVGSIMCSYNKINGNYSCENGWTTNYLLKNELNFQGFVMSDWGAQHSSVESALGGLDMAMPGDGPATNGYEAFWGGALVEAVLGGQVPAWRVDDMAVRIMAAVFKISQTNSTWPEPNFSAWVRPNMTVGPRYFRANASIEAVNLHVNVQADHAELIRELGAKSAVLLKNAERLLDDGADAASTTAAGLPLQRPASLAIIGDDAQAPPPGDAAAAACSDNRCYRGTLAMGYGSGTANFPYVVSPAEALRARAAADGTRVTEAADSWDLEAAQAAAADATVALVFVSADAGEGYITVDGNTGDRNNLTLWGGGDALVQAVAGVNRNTIVVVHSVGAVLLDAIADHENVSAILWAGLPGQESGNALVDVLYGAVPPQGRSPFTWARQAADYGIQLAYTTPDPAQPAQTFDEGVFIDYRYFQRAQIEPLYAFGHGLSYTRFDYANLTISSRETSSSSSNNSTTWTTPAPTFGMVNCSVAANEEPVGFERIRPFIYPWVNASSTSLAAHGDCGGGNGVSSDPRTNGSAQPVLQAGGGPGGNPGLYETVYTVAFDVLNLGSVSATDVPQLYVQLGAGNPWAVLRGFDDVFVPAGESVHVTMALTRRDISNWNTTLQTWTVTAEPKTVLVGRSVADIVLSAPLPSLV